MTKNHIKRLAAPKTWPIERKKTKWIAKPLPGPHPLDNGMTIKLILIDILKYAKSAKEVKKILNEGKILVDNKIRKEEKFPVGLFDVISIPDTNEHFRILLNKKGKFFLHPIKKEESTIKPRKIIGKTILKNKRIQLNFYDGTNKLIDKDEYKVFDTVIFNLVKNEIKEHINFEKGSIVFIYSGKQVGLTGEIEEIKNFNNTQKPLITISKDKDKLQTLKKYAFVIGKTKPVISLPNER